MANVDLQAPTAKSIRAAIADSGERPETAIEACIDRIDRSEQTVKAWACFDAEAVRSAAARLPTARKADRLYGVPVGIKDIIDTAVLPTEYGSPIYIGHQPAADASVVTRIRTLGGLVMGKTATAEFAWSHPPATTNPWNADHTPGGSSSGSAAAVAAGMVPLALGTQTSGSVIRPALFCGVVGVKPTFGLINRTGVKPVADSLDTLGLFARDVGDAAFFMDCLCGGHTDLPETGRGLTIGVLIPENAGQADACAVPAVEEAAKRLDGDGATVRRMTVPSWLDEVFEVQQTIAAYEGARALAFERTAFGDRISDVVKQFIDRGAAMPAATYLAAIKRLDLLRPIADAWLSEVDAVVTIGVNGEAPADLSTTGDSLFCRPWTVLHTPSVAVPMTVGPGGMPVGVQVIAARWADERALAAAHRLDLLTRAARFDAVPRG